MDMNVLTAISIIILLISISAIISSAEISLAASRKIKLQTLANEGSEKAKHVLKLQASPGRFITVVQIGLNMVAILAGVIGESTLTPFFEKWFLAYLPPALSQSSASWVAFIFVTVSFILFADLIPKRIAMSYPEKTALFTVSVMKLAIFCLKPIVLLLDSVANAIFKLFRISTVRDESLTSEDIVALVEEGTEAGILKEQEQYLIENIFDMQTRTVTSSMTARENIIFLDSCTKREKVIQILQDNPHHKVLVCKQNLDNILGYVDTHTLFTHYLLSQDVALTDSRILRKSLFIPDTLSLFEVLELFKSTGGDFGVVVNEYALVVGVITLKDVMNVVMGELVLTEEDQVVRRDENSWLIDGATPLEDVMRALEIDAFPDSNHYETIAGFMMYSLRKVPKKTDFVLFDRYKFEIIDTDNFKVDQLLVSLQTSQNIEKVENKNG